jgi:hypothetical protein
VQHFHFKNFNFLLTIFCTGLITNSLIISNNILYIQVQVVTFISIKKWIEMAALGFGEN